MSSCGVCGASLEGDHPGENLCKEVEECQHALTLALLRNITPLAASIELSAAIDALIVARLDILRRGLT